MGNVRIDFGMSGGVSERFSDEFDDFDWVSATSYKLVDGGWVKHGASSTWYPKTLSTDTIVFDRGMNMGNVHESKLSD